MSTNPSQPSLAFYHLPHFDSTPSSYPPPLDPKASSSPASPASPASAPSAGARTHKTRKYRKHVSCEACRARKAKCDRAVVCSNCKLRNQECVYKGCEPLITTPETSSSSDSAQVAQLSHDLLLANREIHRLRGVIEALQLQQHQQHPPPSNVTSNGGIVVSTDEEPFFVFESPPNGGGVSPVEAVFPPHDGQQQQQQTTSAWDLPVPPQQFYPLSLPHSLPPSLANTSSGLVPFSTLAHATAADLARESSAYEQEHDSPLVPFPLVAAPLLAQQHHYHSHRSFLQHSHPYSHSYSVDQPQPNPDSSHFLPTSSFLSSPPSQQLPHPLLPSGMQSAPPLSSFKQSFLHATSQQQRNSHDRGGGNGVGVEEDQ
ncbi:hypothetical protein JCM8547_003920 [Rhodosporidiobolus lusitaniae]